MEPKATGSEQGEPLWSLCCMSLNSLLVKYSEVGIEFQYPCVPILYFQTHRGRDRKVKINKDNYKFFYYRHVQTDILGYTEPQGNFR